jgi:hypothetical protein
MKDEHRVLFRIAFVFVLAAALFAYAYFLYPPLRAQLASNYHARSAIEKEKEAIAEIIIDPSLISERIADLQEKLSETRSIKDLTPAGVIKDITRNADRFGLDLQSIVLGASEAQDGTGADGRQLLAMPITVYIKAPYDGGMYFIGSLEKSETGNYKIGAFSFEPAQTESGGGTNGADGAESGGGTDGAGDADGAESGGGTDGAGDAESGGGTDGADGAESGGGTDGAGAGAKARPLLNWAITIRLLYYG